MVRTTTAIEETIITWVVLTTIMDEAIEAEIEVVVVDLEANRIRGFTVKCVVNLDMELYNAIGALINNSKDLFM